MSKRNTVVDFERQFIPEPNSGCWLWTGYSPNGRYGAMQWQNKRTLAHIIAYQIFKRKKRSNRVIDHLCNNTFCVNPDHLAETTQLKNTQRSIPAIKTHCVHGHPYLDGMEIYYRSDNQGIKYRRCLTCYRMRYPGTTK